MVMMMMMKMFGAVHNLSVVYVCFTPSFYVNVVLCI